MVKTLSVAQAQAFDRAAQVEQGVPSIVLMENAGRSVAEAVRERQGIIAVVCGTGNNGGDGFVAARHLLNAGRKVKVYVVGAKDKLKADPRTNLNILNKLGQKINWVKSEQDLSGLKRAELIVDALFGIGLSKPVEGIYRRAIEDMNKSGVPILAVDVPSGLNADTGEVMGAVVRAQMTVTFVAAKKGCFLAAGPKMCGKIIIKDIGVAI